MIVESQDSIVCLLCGKSEDHSQFYGEILHKEDIYVHHFCLVIIDYSYLF